MSAEHKAKIRAGKLAAAAARKQQQGATSEDAASVSMPAVEQVGGVEVAVTPSQGTATSKSLLERVKEGLKSQPTSPKGDKKPASGKEDESFIFVFVPVISGFIAYQAGTLWAPEYLMCAPTRAEVSAVLTPLTRIVARRISLKIEETPDIRDMRLAGTALLLYVVRSATAAIDIHAKIDQQKAVSYAEQHLDSRRHYQSAVSGTGGPGRDASGGAIGGRIQPEPATAAGGRPETDAEYARRVISEARQQDIEYRAQHGLL